MVVLQRLVLDGLLDDVRRRQRRQRLDYMLCHHGVRTAYHLFLLVLLFLEVLLVCEHVKQVHATLVLG